MIGKKSGKSCVKKFILIDTKLQFDKLPGGLQCHLQQRKDKNSQQIIIPAFSQIQPLWAARTEPLPEHYVKYKHNKQFLSKQNYELDETDLSFISSLKPQFKNINKIIAAMIVSLQKKAYKYETEFNYKKVLSKKLNQFSISLDPQQSQKLMKNIYNYWRNKRRNLQSPLLRLFWSKGETGPFKYRGEINSLCLRNRAIKVENDVIQDTLKQDIRKLKNIFALMKKRQLAELKLIKLQSESFEKACKKVLKKVQKTLQDQAEESQQETISLLKAKKPPPKQVVRQQLKQNARGRPRKTGKILELQD